MLEQYCWPTAHFERNQACMAICRRKGSSENDFDGVLEQKIIRIETSTNAG
ncbi:MAG: hypothetical protein ACJA04_001009 [Cellvibrionaceae bacterium]|jgi:hypothetical protein